MSAFSNKSFSHYRCVEAALPFSAVAQRLRIEGGIAMKNLWYRFWKEEDGIGVVEMILILVVLIGLVIIFKSQLTTLVNNIFDKITTQSGTI